VRAHFVKYLPHFTFNLQNGIPFINFKNKMSEKNSFHIVLADDDLDDQYLMKHALAQLQLKIDTTSVYTGYELLNLLFKREAFKNHKKTPDLILLDINMPLLDGFGVLRRIRERQELKTIPVYVLSTSRSELDRKMSLDLGARGFYTKPVDSGGLHSQIAEIIKELAGAPHQDKITTS
jgi:two-component system response regulator